MGKPAGGVRSVDGSEVRHTAILRFFRVIIGNSDCGGLMAGGRWQRRAGAAGARGRIAATVLHDRIELELPLVRRDFAA